MADPGRTTAERESQRLGRFGEQQAVRYLEAQGYRVLERNWRCRHGEIDVVASRDGVLVFVEVKTRTSAAFGHPFEAITVAKLRRMHVLARLWCEARPQARGSVRLDVIGILAPIGEVPRIEHLEGVHA
ncbi:hypothetical protein ASC66_00165 [Leifsonia sp. Root4]|jgi:putative endonuclease|uniref:YraN family protein n=1 Tax=Leifsonia sp. Root4 TaxID=1736525 RepID=UPI0006FE600A|nr:YraN family protein [Leifsonia sp. Root4]KQW07474.1 hypothetical protein ASC66_00165 [Leifsonia sp. Root4]